MKYNSCLRKILSAVGCLLAVGVIFTSCKKDDNGPLPSLENKTYTGADLDIEYNGTTMTGKYATLVTGSEKPVLVLGSTVNLGEYLPALAAVPAVPGPGVLPGTPVLQLPLTLTPDGKEYRFSGNGETDFVTYSYSGDITDGKLEIDFNNVTLKNKGLGGTAWKPAPIGKNIPGQGYTSLPFHIVWKADMPGLQQVIDGDIQDLLQVLTTLPTIPVYNGTAYMSPAQAIVSAVQALGINTDGNMIVTYLQTVNGAAQFAQAPKCMIQYVPTSASSIQMFINPLDLIGQILVNGSTHPDLPEHPFGKPSRAADTTVQPDQAMMGALQYLLPMLAKGIPMQVAPSASGLAVYMNTQTLTPLMEKVVMPLLQDPAVQALILTKLGDNPALAPKLASMQKLFTYLPQIVAATTQVEIGLNLIKYQ